MEKLSKADEINKKITDYQKENKDRSAYDFPSEFSFTYDVG